MYVLYIQEESHREQKFLTGLSENVSFLCAFPLLGKKVSRTEKTRAREVDTRRCGEGAMETISMSSRHQCHNLSLDQSQPAVQAGNEVEEAEREIERQRQLSSSQPSYCGKPCLRVI